MTSTQPVETNTPPYLPFARFQSFIGQLHGKPLPPRIDRTLMSRMSGSDQSQIRIALKFLGLTKGDESLVTDEFRVLIAAFGDPASADWKTSLGKVVTAAYEPIVGALDDAATQGQLEDAFRILGGLAGSSMTKAIRFYLAAAAEAGVAVSPHFKGANAPANGGSSKRSRKPKESAPEVLTKPQERKQETIPEDMDEVGVTLLGRTARVLLPKNLSQKEFDHVITTLTSWRALRED